MTTIVNIHKRQEYDVYIGRAGKRMDGYFGNPIPIAGSREECLEAYTAYFNKRIKEDPEFASRVAALKGKRLGCFCAPHLCHGMVIIEYLEGITVKDQMLILEAEEQAKRLASLPPSIFDE